MAIFRASRVAREAQARVGGKREGWGERAPTGTPRTGAPSDWRSRADNRQTWSGRAIAGTGRARSPRPALYAAWSEALCPLRRCPARAAR
eukprot:5406991-Alexandrium_andersonii.AAC.1